MFFIEIKDHLGEKPRYWSDQMYKVDDFDLATFYIRFGDALSDFRNLHHSIKRVARIAKLYNPRRD